MSSEPLFQSLQPEKPKKKDLTNLSKTAIDPTPTPTTQGGTFHKTYANMYMNYGGSTLHRATPDNQNPTSSIRKLTFDIEDPDPTNRTLLKRFVDSCIGVNGWVKTYFSLINGMMALGVLYLPQGFVRGGWGFGIIILTISCSATTWGIHKLIEVREIYGGSFSELGFVVMGKWGKVLVDLCLCMSQTGFTTAYIVFIGISLKYLTKQWGFEIDMVWSGIGCLFILGGLCMIRDVAKFATSHIVADLIMFGACFMIMGYAFYKLYGQTGEKAGMAKGIQAFNWESCLMFLGMSIYAFEGVGVVVPIHQQMKAKSRFSSVLYATMSSLLFIKVGYAVVAYFAYADSTPMKKSGGLVTEALPPDQIPVQIMKILYFIPLVPSYVLALYPALRIIEKAIFFGDTENPRRRYWLQNLCRFLHVGVTVIIGVFLGDKYDYVQAIIGALFCAPIAFIFPALFHYKLVGKKQGVLTQVGNVGFIIFGFFCLIFSAGITVWHGIAEEKKGD